MFDYFEIFEEYFNEFLNFDNIALLSPVDNKRTVIAAIENFIKYMNPKLIKDIVELNNGQKRRNSTKHKIYIYKYDKKNLIIYLDFDIDVANEIRVPDDILPNTKFLHKMKSASVDKEGFFLKTNLICKILFHIFHSLSKTLDDACLLHQRSLTEFKLYPESKFTIKSNNINTEMVGYTKSFILSF